MALSLPDRTALGIFPTPLQRDRALGEVLGLPSLWVKRDDLSGFSWGGNKVRTVEFLLAHAIAKGATDLVVAGGPTSNFAATLAAAGSAAGIVVHQVAYGVEPDNYPPALCASLQAGSNIVFTESNDRGTMEVVAAKLAASLSSSGRTALAIPRGGATSVGSMGFVAAAIELHDQLHDIGLSQATIVLPVGSGGSVTGLLAGRTLLGIEWSIIGMSVSRPANDFTDEIVANAAKTATVLGGSPIPGDYSQDFRIVDCRGEGFGVVTDQERSFGRHVSATTGLLIDHTYNTKPLHWLSGQGLSGQALSGQSPTGEATEIAGPVIYWLTGGAFDAMSQLCQPNKRLTAVPIDQKDNDR